MNSKQNTSNKNQSSNKTHKEPNHTPGQAEGDEKTVNKALKSQGSKSK